MDTVPGCIFMIGSKLRRRGALMDFTRLAPRRALEGQATSPVA